VTEHPYLGGPRPRAYAHRGWHLDELAGLENTTAAFRRAVDEGFSYLELDVHATADGVAVVHHDRTLDRTTLLADVLAALPTARVTVEVKAAAAVAPVLEVLARLDAWDRVCVGGYHEAWLRAARRLGGRRLFTSMAKASVVGLRLRGWGRPGPPVRGDLAQLPDRFAGVQVVDADVLRVAHDLGREVHVWTVDDPARMAGLLDLGVDGLLTDRPDLLRDLLVARGCWAGPH
jgi:glycerophosphoryl diester phosphodiesterase